MKRNNEINKYKVVVIGGGQSGLTVGYFLKRNNIPFIILDANKRIGDAWRNRWDSLYLFTPAKYDGLSGMKFPADPYSFPTKDDMADYLENYAQHFELPVKTGIKVDGLSKEGDKYCISAGDKYFEAEHVVIAMSNYQHPRIPKFADELDENINRFHSLNYKGPEQLQDGDVLVVGAGNSGCEIALEAARHNHKVWLSGRDVGNIPFNIEGYFAKLFLIWLVIRFLFHRVLTTGTPIGRAARPKIISQGGPLIRIRPKQIDEAGIKRVPKMKGVRGGLPLLENGQVVDIKNVVWCKGFHPSFSRIDIPIFQKIENLCTIGEL